MKKHAYTILIFIICTLFIYLNVQKPHQYKVIDVYDAGFICVDINNNTVCENNEKFKIYGISTFPKKFGKQTLFIKDRYKIKEKDSVVLSILAKEYTKKTLLNKYVTINILDESNQKYRLAKIIFENVDYAKTLLKNGWAFAPNNDSYKIYENFGAIKKNIKYSKNFNYQLKNLKTGKIHTLDCEYGKKSENYEIGIFDDEKSKKNYCNFCHNIKSEIKKTASQNFNYNTDIIKVYFTDFTKTLKPNSACTTLACKNLLYNINNSKHSIDFAIYGLGKVPEIENALINAASRGVKIRYVFDEDSKKENIYEKTKGLTTKLHNYKSDYIEGESSKFNNFIMHNKFFIFDDKSVWLGTANVSETDLSGFSANNIIFIKSEALAKIYKAEFERLYNGTFHTKKSISSSDLTKLAIGNSQIRVAFSPQDRVISNYLIKMINNTKKSIYIQTFIITHKTFSESLINAHKRGVDIKIIVDATSATNNYSLVKYLRDNGIKVKVENYAGKMHMKTLLIDDEYFITGSMNLTKSGDQYNDENILFIKNSQIVHNAKNFFEYIWEKIPNKYLYKNLSAESKASIGSCSDGVDNDYNGKIDLEDEKCK